MSKLPIQTIATTPKSMAASQKDVVNWVDSKISTVEADLMEMEANLEHAKKNKWKISGWQSQVSKAKARKLFYQKTRESILAGFHIVPPVGWVDIFAVRTKVKSPRIEKARKKSWHSNPSEIRAQALDVGYGDYVSPNKPALYWTEGKGDEKTYHMETTGEFADVDFPFKLVKPELVNITSQAMALKIFDEIGVIGAQKSDPIILGRIKHPSREPLNFLIAWWLNFEDL